ncbi:MAG: S-layer homology domain-containing protein [Oscillospiraceae bacterium]|nr:S-layer homology domain-containing protein [Oscillospiraceae bacterium]
MKIRMSRRIIALALAFFMVVGLLPSVAFARTAGKDGSAAMNEDYEAKKSLMPIGPSFSTYTLLEWTVESDPDAAYSRASIPLKERVGGFVVNPLANPEAKLMLCSLANSDHDHTSAQGTESFLSYSFNYWQYVDSFVYWSGSQEGIVVVPTGEFTDAAHTNGVPVVATLGFPWGSGSGYVEEVNAFCQKAADGTFPVADKLIEVMDYYGFDGYFFNQESYGCSAEMATRLNEMIHYMHAKRPDMLISWYDSMIESGSVSYGDGVNDYNKFWMKDDANGVRGVDEFFMNYNWTASKIAGTITSMRSVGRSEFDAFAGLDVQQNCMKTWFSDHLLVDEDGLAKLSLALYCPNSTLGLSADGAQFHEVERTFYTNAVEDPRDTSVDVTDSSVSAWAGMSRLFADKTPITSAPFITDFNSGHGTGYYVDGVLMRDAEWSYQSNQDVMPTWTWIIDSTGAKLEGDYDFTDAYNGGNSIKFHGNLNAVNDILLYSTNIAVENKMTLSLTAKGGLEQASLVAYLDDGSAAAYADCEQVITKLNTGDGWVETVVDLSDYAGSTLKAIGLKIEGSDAAYQLNLGRIAVLDKARAALNGPASITLDEIMYTDAYTAEARIQWAKVTGAASYEIYKVNADGTKSLIMETPATAFYIPALKRAADEENVTIEILPINRSGVRGSATELTIDWLYGNDDSDEVVVQSFENVALNATVTDVSFQNDGEPASKALDGTSANNSKWCATNMGSGYMAIDIGREVTVKRWRVEHAEYGGEANNMNTVDFALEYKDKGSNTWVEVKRITNNHDAVTDVLLDTPITAQEWRLYVYDDGSSPWGGIRIYEWQMFETDQFPQTDVVPMHFASAVNNAGADDTFTLKNVPNGVTVKVYNAEGTELGSAVSDGNDVVISGLDFGTADAGRVFYTTTAQAAAESAKLSAPFEAEAAEKSAAAEDVSFVTYSHPGSVTSYNGDDVYTTLTVNGLNSGDVVYVYENGADAEYTKVSLPVAEGQTSVSVNRVLVPRAGGQLTLRVKRVGFLLSDAYQVTAPSFGAPTASLKVFARNESGESLTGVRFELRDAEGNVVAQLSTTSDSGATVTAELGTYYLHCVEVPAGYNPTKEVLEVKLAIEGWTYEQEILIPTYVDAAVTSVTLNTHELITTVGSENTFIATVEGEGFFSEELVWTVEGAQSADTAISGGVLTVAADETAQYLRVTATSAVDSTKSDTALVFLTELTNVATMDGAIPFAYYNNYTGDYYGPDANPASNIFDGDYTTKWADVIKEGYYAFYGILLPEAVDIAGVRLYNAGSNGEDTRTNTVSFQIVKDKEGDSWNNQTWYNTYYTYSGYYVSNNYGEVVTTVTGNTDDVTTVLFDEALNTDGLYIKVTDPSNWGDDLNIYELELLGMDLAAVSAAKRQVLLDLIASVEELNADEYTLGSWTMLEMVLAEAEALLDNESAKDDEILAAADELRAAIDGLKKKQQGSGESGILSKNAEIIAYNGAKLNDASAGPEKLFDGTFDNEQTSKWCEDGVNLWVAFDLGNAADVSNIKLYHAGSNGEWQPAGASTNTAGYELYVLNTDKITVDELLSKSFEERTTLLADNSYWTEIAAVTGNTADTTSHDVSLSGVRIFKFNVSDTDTTNWGDCIRVYELEVTGGTGVSAPDKTYLEYVYNTVKSAKSKDYTPETWADFAEALANAEAVLADENADQTTIDNAMTDLLTAYQDLQLAEVALQKIFHLDSGRTFYSKDWTIALLNELSAAGYTHLQLAFGNDGFRFVLDDMTIEANGKTYASDDVKAAIELGNEEYTKTHTDNADDSICAGQAFAQHALTEAEMDEIIAHAQSVGIEIIPHLNMPGHMDALLDAMVELGISGAHFTGYSTSDRSLNLENAEAVAFLQALLDKYAKYFSENGSWYFHIGADEYGNDAYSGSMGFPSMGSALYAKFADFVNANAAIVEGYGMTARAWNDGIYYGSYNAEFDPDIEITYWSSGWWGYDLAKTSKFIEKGNGLINTHGDYYYILGVNDKFTPGNTAEHDPSLYTEAATYDINYFMDGSTVTDPVGGMFCVWGDHPFGETEQEVAANVRLVLRAMALRMDGKSLDGMDTSVVEGGFNEDGTINGEVVEPVTYTITIDETEGGTVTADKAEAAEGETVTLTVTPDEGYSLVAIYVNGTELEGTTFEMPAEDVTITATFAADSLEDAIKAAQEAQAAAEAAQAAAEEALKKAEEAQAAADEAAASAAEDKEAAEKAQAEADEALAAAEAAQAAAEEAQAAAEEAAAAAEANDLAAAEAAAEAAKHAQEVAELYQEIADMKAQMAEYLKEAQESAEAAEEYRKAAEAAELACAKYYALIRLAQYADNKDFTEAQDAEADAIVDEYNQIIKNAESVAAVEEALAAALAAIDAIGTVSELPFVDVPVDSFYYDSVKWAVDNGITTGTSETTFSPDKVVTRAEAVTFLWRAAGEPEPTSSVNPFTDVAESDFFYKAVLWAVEEGITNDMTDTTFGPYLTANRAQIVTFLWRAEGQPETTGTNSFADVVAGAWYEAPINWAVENGITNGLSATEFGIDAECNRAQMVTFLYRAYN